MKRITIILIAMVFAFIASGQLVSGAVITKKTEFVRTEGSWIQTFKVTTITITTQRGDTLSSIATEVNEKCKGDTCGRITWQDLFKENKEKVAKVINIYRMKEADIGVSPLPKGIKLTYKACMPAGGISVIT